MQLLFPKSCFLEAANFPEYQYSAATVFFRKAALSKRLPFQKSFFFTTYFFRGTISRYTAFAHILFLFIAEKSYHNAMTYFLQEQIIPFLQPKCLIWKVFNQIAFQDSMNKTIIEKFQISVFSIESAENPAIYDLLLFIWNIF